VSGMTFRGIRKDYITVLRGRKRPPWAPIQRNILTIPGLPGGHLLNTEVGPRPLEVPVLIKADSFSNLQKLKEDLAAWLVTDTPQELIFDDEPDRVYYAVVDGSLDLEELVNCGKGTIKFICPDPYKYSASEKYVKFNNSAASFNVGGTVETEPVITVEVAQATTFLAVGNGDQINMIGNPAEAEQQTYERETLVFWDEMGSTTSWLNSTNVEEGVAAGTMKTNGYEFYTDDYGTGSGWHGPAVKKSIGQTLQDFRIEALVEQYGLNGQNGQVGSIEIALLDVNNQFVAKMLISKRSAQSDWYHARVRVGSAANGDNITNGIQDYWFAWKSKFEGIMRIERVGTFWSVYYAWIDEKWRHMYEYEMGAIVTDYGTAPIAQVQVQLWQCGNIPPTTQRIQDLKIYKINKQPQGIPYVTKAGDIIEFDHKYKVIRKNGENITKEKAFIGEYFKLKPGQNSIVVEPSARSVEVRWREKWR
jgi:predicted phage tail component-like protein